MSTKPSTCGLKDDINKEDTTHPPTQHFHP